MTTSRPLSAVFVDAFPSCFPSWSWLIFNDGRRKMKTVRLLFLALLAASMCFVLEGCSLAVWARVFNRSGHEISIRDRDGKTVVVAPDGNAPLALWATPKGEQRGFVVVDGARELFFAVRPDTKANRDDTRFASPILPSVSAKTTAHGIEFQFEYSGDSEIVALVPGTATPRRANPQPAGFPIKPTP
jgi:hypothetical protein